jgi:hypothetical protein
MDQSRVSVKCWAQARKATKAEWDAGIPEQMVIRRRLVAGSNRMAMGVGESDWSVMLMALLE